MAPKKSESNRVNTLYLLIVAVCIVVIVEVYLLSPSITGGVSSATLEELRSPSPIELPRRVITTPVCGNGVLDSGEECELGDPLGSLCSWSACNQDMCTCEETGPFISVASAFYYSCGLTTTGGVYCWGDNEYDSPTVLPGEQTFSTITEGYWGDNGRATPSGEWYHWRDITAEPEYIDAPFPYTTIVRGYDFACGLTAAGKAYCWGSNTAGQLGSGSFGGAYDSANPAEVVGNHTFVSITAGVRHVCGVTTEGDIYCWGNEENGRGQLGTGGHYPDGCESVPSLGSIHACPFPVPVDLSNVDNPNFDYVETLSHHTCAISNGDVYCWGHNAKGTLGDGTQENRDKPVPVDNTFLGDRSFMSLSLGTYLSCGVTTAGEAYCWGGDYLGQLGTNGQYTEYCGSEQMSWPGYCSMVPVPVNMSNLGGQTFTSLSAGGKWFICGLTSGQEIYCWGNDYEKELGDGEGSPETCRRPGPGVDYWGCSKVPVRVDMSGVQETHTECVGTACVVVEGVGTDECASDADCQTTACTDPDGGKYVHVAGSTCDSEGCESDYCVYNNERVFEYYCTGDVKRKKPYDCAFGCSDGACIGTTPSSCSDPDNTNENFIQSLYTRTTVTTNIGESLTDTCLENNSPTVREYRCDDLNQIAWTNYICPNGCSNGACLSTTSNATTAPSIDITPLSQTVNVGEEVTITVNINDVVDLFSYEMTLNYDEDILDLVSIDQGTFLGGQFIPGVSDPGMIRQIAEFRPAGQPGVSGSGGLFSVTFIAEAPSTSTITLTDISLYNSDYELIDHVVEGATITVGEPFECGNGHIDNGNGTCTAIFYDPHEDGNVFDDGGFQKDTTDIYLNMGKRVGTNWIVHRSYVEWDISSIPDTATITDTKFIYSGGYQTNSEIWDMPIRPSISDPESTFNQIGVGTEYDTPNAFPSLGGPDVDLGASADNDLQGQISSGWFAIGFKSWNEDAGSGSWVDSEESPEADPIPTLVITYTPSGGELGRGGCRSKNCDLNHDGVIGLADALQVMGSWGLSEGDAGWDSSVDLNEDGNIGLLDVLPLMGVWGESV